MQTSGELCITLCTLCRWVVRCFLVSLMNVMHDNGWSNGDCIAARVQGESLFYGAPCGANAAPIPSYSSLSDPHLFEYFAKKFANPHPPMGVSIYTCTMKIIWKHAISGRLFLILVACCLLLLQQQKKRRVDSHKKSALGSHKRANTEDKAGALYKVAVVTGDKKGAGTDAKVHCHCPLQNWDNEGLIMHRDRGEL